MPDRLQLPHFALLARWRRRTGRPAYPGPAQRLVVLHLGPSPTLDYFLPAFARQRPGLPLVTIDMAAGNPDSADLRDGDAVVILRYLPEPWRILLSARVAGLAELIYFMDDDLLDPLTLRELPKDYAGRVRRLATTYRHWLPACCSGFWVSTPALAGKYADLSPAVVGPRPAAWLLERRALVKVVYHGSGSHRGEVLWLRPVVENVQAQTDDIHFEFFGDKKVKLLFRGIPRVAVQHPLHWHNYLAFTASHARDIGLAPLLPSRFNIGRGNTKFFDFARLGAVGLYSRSVGYVGFVRDGIDGLLLDNDPAAWADAIIALAHDPDRRRRMAEQARLQALSLSDAGLPP